MKWFILCLAVVSATALKLNNKHPCDYKECRAGRECVVEDGRAQCLCVVSCPDHLKPVCGTDGVSYDNHCQLHQKACISAEHISIEHKGYCKSSYDKQWKKDKKKSLLGKDDLDQELQNDLIKMLKKSEQKSTVEHKKGPAVCFSPQRNALRFLLVEHWSEDLKSQSWHNEGTTYREGLWGWFYTCDTNKDNFMTPEELLECATEVDFFARPGQDNELTKALCMDALIDDGDRNQDWRLDFEEFTRVMDPKYEPKEKKCSLEGKNYLDGEEIHVDCNHCVCGVGNWVCASTDCEKGHELHKTKNQFHPASSGNDIDNAIDTEVTGIDTNDVIDKVSVTDSWMENNRKDKRKGKESKKDDFDVEDNMFLDYDLGTEDSDAAEVNDEEEELGLEDYYEDLESTKVKKSKKKKYQLTNALKEIKLLLKETENLKKRFAKQNDAKNLKQKEKKHLKQKQLLKAMEEKEKQRYDQMDTHTHKSFDHKQNKQKGKDTKNKKHYDQIFENTNWNDLIDWGKMKEVQKSALTNKI